MLPVSLSFTCLLLLCLVCNLHLVQGRGIWRKKPRDEDLSAAAASADLDAQADFRMPPNAVQNARRNRMAGDSSESSMFALFSMFETYLDQMEAFVESPQFSETVTPDLVKSMFDQIPGMATSPQLMETLNSDKFSDPSAFKETVRLGLSSIRTYLVSFKEIMNDPVKLKEALDLIPEEYRGLMDQLMSGDTSGLQSMLSSLPGVTDANKQMLESMLTGDSAKLSNTLKSVFEDNSQLELARQQFLQNPELAEAFGISLDILQDKDQWASLMKEGLAALEGETSTGSKGRVL